MKWVQRRARPTHSWGDMAEHCAPSRPGTQQRIAPRPISYCAWSAAAVESRLLALSLKPFEASFNMNAAPSPTRAAAAAARRRGSDPPIRTGVASRPQTTLQCICCCSPTKLLRPNPILSRKQGSTMKLPMLALCLATIWPSWSSAQTPLSNTPVTEAQISHLFTSNKLVLYHCQEGILDDLGNRDGGWGEPASPGRIISAAWDIGGNRYLYAYQLSNPNWLEGNDDFNGGWDVALDGFSTFRIPLGPKQIIPVDFDGDNILDTSFHTTDHACDVLEDQPNPGCAPFTGPFSVFTAGTNNCGRSWSDYYIDYGGVSNDAIVSGYIDYSLSTGGAHFRVQYDPFCCAYGIFHSTQVFGFVTDAPPDTVYGAFLGCASASIRIVAPVPRVLLVPGICGNAADWDPFEQALVDSGFVVYRLQYGSQFFSLPPAQYVNILDAMLKGMGAGRVAVVAHSMGGLIAREYMRRTKPRDNKIGQLVTMGTPHHGADFVRKVLRMDPFRRGVIGAAVGPCLSTKDSRLALTDMLPGS